MDLPLLYERARIIRELRSFFDFRQYLELDTPLLAPDLIPESCLEVFETSWLPPLGSRQQPEKRWLIPSPEIWMKQLIARYDVNMYQICKCFRNTESRGHLHNPEFTMLEYYTMNAGYLDSLVLTEGLFNHITNTVPGRANSPLGLPFIRITMEEAFCTWAGFSLFDTANAGRGAMEREARRLGLEPASAAMDEKSAIAQLYDLIFVHTVEPSLPKDRPVALMDYPDFVHCLAKNKNNHGKHYSAKERWELYFNGIELANCYSEETDPAEIRRFFEEEAKLKEQNAVVKHRINYDYWKNFVHQPKNNPITDGGLPKKSGFPSCTGVALGVDRLIMAFTGNFSIENVLSFIF